MSVPIVVGNTAMNTRESYMKAGIDSKSLNKQFVLSLSFKLSKMFAFGKYNHVYSEDCGGLVGI